MGYVLLWIESLTAALLLQALVTACAGRWERLTRAIVSIAMALTLLTLAGGVTFVVGFMRYAFLMRAVPFLSVLTWTISFAVGAVWILWSGLKRRKDDGKPAARTWPRSRLALATAAALLVNGITFTNLDLAMKLHLAAVRAEAGAQILALAPLQVPDRDNAALVYLEAFDALTPSAKLPAAWREKEDDWLSLDRSKLHPRDKDVADFLATQEVGLALVRQGAAMPGCSFDRSIPYYMDMLGSEYKLFRCARLLGLDAVVKAARGDARGASLDLAAIQSITRHLDYPSFMSVIRESGAERTRAKALEEVLAFVRLEGDNLNRLVLSQGVSYRDKMRRAHQMDAVTFGLSSFAVAAGEDSDNWPGEPDKGVDDKVKKALPSGAVWRVFFLQNDLAEYRRRMREGDELTAKPYYESLEGFKAFEQSFRAKSIGADMVTHQILPAFDKMALFMTEADAARQLARLALAATAYRNKTGHYPARLEDLVPGYLSQIPTDPFDGKLLRMKQVGEGRVFYSVGPDMKDDSGQAYHMPERTGDIVFTLR